MDGNKTGILPARRQREQPLAGQSVGVSCGPAPPLFGAPQRANSAFITGGVGVVSASSGSGRDLYLFPSHFLSLALCITQSRRPTNSL